MLELGEAIYPCLLPTVLQSFYVRFIHFFMKKLLFLCFLCGQFTLFAQENINLHFDKHFYALGETIWYNAYLSPENPTAQQAKMLRVELVDKEGIIQQKNNLRIEDGRAKGALVIPLDWEEGWYTFHAYTVWNPKPTIKNSATVNIPIYDDFKEHQEHSVTDIGKTNNFKNSLTSTIKTDKKQYQRKAVVTVDLALSTTIKTGNISVAVVSKELTNVTNTLQVTQADFTTTALQKPEALNTVYRQIASTENAKKPLGIGANYAEDNALQWTAADENGVFATTNQLGRNQPTQFFGLFNNQNKTYTTALPTEALKLTAALSTKASTTEKLPFDKAIKKYLTQRQQRKKYQEIFGLEKAVLTSMENVEKQNFQPDVVYNLADYASMTTLEEFLVEVVPFVRIKTKKGKPTVRMFNELKEFTKENPVYLVNDWLTYDQELVLNIPIAEVESISIYRTTNTLKSQFGILGNEGVIGIKTKAKNAMKMEESLTNITSVQGILKAPTFSTLKTTFNRLPNFRSLIYWNSDVVIKDGKAQITFPHSDDLGEFIITVKGMTADGQLIEGSGTYQVN